MSKEIKDFMIIPNDNKINEYNACSFIFPLVGYSVGFDKYFTVDEINKYATTYEVSVILNKFLHSEDLKNIKAIIKNLKGIKYYFIEDFAYTNILDNEKIVFFPNHIISNYNSINYLNDLGFNNVLVSNELTIDELIQININTKSNLFYMYLGYNNIMYSKRELLSNYYNYYDIKGKNNVIELVEEVSKHKLIFMEEEKSTMVFNGNIFCASKYINELSDINKIINFTNINDKDKKIILNNIDNKELCDLIDSDFKFLEEQIMYKVGDLK